MLPKVSAWIPIINIIVQNYLFDTTICIIWNEKFEIQLDSRAQHSAPYAVININPRTLAESFESDVVDFAEKRAQLEANGVIFNDLVEKLTMSIETSHCESFLTFGMDIPVFVEAFTNASKYSIWRSKRNKFVFAYCGNTTENNYFQHKFFQDQLNILLIESSDDNLRYFDIKTNKYIGSRAENPEKMYLLDRFNVETGKFQCNEYLFPNKIENLQGREVVLAAFDYRPAMVLKFDAEKNVRNRDTADPKKETALLDGTEVRILLTFCEKYNCTVEIDTSEADDWGAIYPNTSGDGALGMVSKGKAEIAMGAMYTWREPYVSLDMSMYISRSGITCIVPVPRRLASWFLPLEPFQSTLWGAVIFCLFIEIFVLIAMKKFQQIIQAEPSSWSHCIVFGCSTTLKLFISQPSDSETKAMALRIFLFACFMNDIIISSIYDGGLASILTIPSFEEAADSLERLQSFHLKWAANSEAWVASIRDGEDPIMNDILENFHIYPDEELRQMAMTEYMGFTLERLPFGHFAIEDYYTSDIIDRFKIMQDDIYYQYTVTFVPRVWPLLELYDNMISMWHSSGFAKTWEWRVVVENLNTHVQKQVEASTYSSYEDIGPVKLGITNFAGILVIWLLGIIFASLAFLVEMSLHTFYQSNRR